MAFIEKAKPKRPTKGLAVQIDHEVKEQFEAYVEFIGRSQGPVVSDILAEAMRQDSEFTEWKRTRPVKGKRARAQGNVESMPAAQSA